MVQYSTATNLDAMATQRASEFDTGSNNNRLDLNSLFDNNLTLPDIDLHQFLCSSENNAAITTINNDDETIYNNDIASSDINWTTALTPVTSSSFSTASSSGPASLNTSPDQVLFDRIVDFHNFDIQLDIQTPLFATDQLTSTTIDKTNPVDNVPYTDFLLFPPDFELDIEQYIRSENHSTSSSPVGSFATSATAVTTSPHFDPLFQNTPGDSSSLTSFASPNVESLTFNTTNQHSLVTPSELYTEQGGYMTRSTSSSTPMEISNDTFVQCDEEGSTRHSSSKIAAHQPQPHPLSNVYPTSPPTSPLTISSSTSSKLKRNQPTEVLEQPSSSSPSASVASSSNKRARTSETPQAAEIDISSLSPSDIKRVRNTQAARRYRQKKVDRMEQLERLLAEAEKERDGWKEEAMKWRCEAQGWRGKCEGLLGVGVGVGGIVGKMD